MTGFASNKQMEAVSIEIPETTGPCINTGLADNDLCEISETDSEPGDIQRQTNVESQGGSKDVDKNLQVGTICVNKKTGFFTHGTGHNDNIHSENASRSSDTTKVPAVKQNGEAFRGANMKHLHGYAGLQITRDNVHRKLSKLREYH